MHVELYSCFLSLEFFLHTSSKLLLLKYQKHLHLSVNSKLIILFCSAELALKARREISDYIAAGKEDRARIRVRFSVCHIVVRENWGC